MNIVIAGASGFIGQKLVSFWQDNHQITVVGRNLKKLDQIFSKSVHCVAWSDLENMNANDVDIVINLSGKNIGDGRWSASSKKAIIESRVQTTQKLIDWLAEHHSKAHFYCANAVGLYGLQDTTHDSHQTEEDIDTIQVTDFLAEVGLKWKKAAEIALEHQIPLTITCFGVVLGKGDGMLKKLAPAFYCGLGSVMGDGKQMISWVHIDDVVNAFDYLINNPEITGLVNLCSPNPVPQKVFAQGLAKAMKRPMFLKTPAFVIKLLFGEMGECLILKGQSVWPERLLNHGYEFKYKTIDSALAQVFIE